MAGEEGGERGGGGGLEQEQELEEAGQLHLGLELEVDWRWRGGSRLLWGQSDREARDRRTGVVVRWLTGGWRWLGVRPLSVLTGAKQRSV